MAKRIDERSIPRELYLREDGAGPFALPVMWWCHAIPGAEIRPSAVIGPGLVIVHPTGIVISGGAVIGSGVQLFGQNLLGANEAHGRHGTPRLGDDVVLSHGAKA